MKPINKSYILLIASLFVLLIQLSCDKDEDNEPAPRIFRPIAQFDNSIENTLIVYFKAIDGAVLYEADLSEDSTFQRIEKTVLISPDTAEIMYNTTKYTHIRFDNLLAAQDYFIRLRAIHADTTMNSEYYELKATTQTIFVNPTANEILDVAFKAKWDVKGNLLTKITIRLAETNEFVADYWVLDSENENGIKVIDGLQGNTSYIIYLYSRDRLRGKGYVTTKPSIEGNIVDLRFTDSNIALWDTIHKVESGAIILLKRGQTYIFPSAREISGSVTVMSGYDFVSELAVIELNGNPFRTPLNAFIDEIIFRDINVTSSYLGDSYFIYLEELANVKKIKFKNVQSQGHRGFFRIGPEVLVDSFIIENCVIDTLREYGISHISGANANVKNIHITNSTFTHVVRPFFCASTAVNASNTINIENCTFYHTPDGNRYFFDYSVESNVQIKNSIFGAQFPIFSTTEPARGYRPNTIDISIIGSYATSDFVLDESDLELSLPFDLIPYDGNSTNLFEDPDNHNFKISDYSFPGKTTAGDPRWH